MSNWRHGASAAREGDARARERRDKRHRRAPSTRHILLGAATALAFAIMLATAATALAETATYSATETIPVPPASHFAGYSGGDGWGLALSEKYVFNVFHHQNYLGFACHVQTTSADCFESGTYDTITEPSTGTGFHTSPQPGMYLDHSTGKLYVYATREGDGVAGVVCIDTVEAVAQVADPFCGFTELTGNQESPEGYNGISDTSDPILIGTHLYSFNYVEGKQEGAKNKILCFDVSTDGPCAGQPYALDITGGEGEEEVQISEPLGESAGIAGKMFIPLRYTNGGSSLLCFEDATQSTCAGKWPVDLHGAYSYGYGAPFPLLETSGKADGLCLPMEEARCMNFAGEEVTAPSGLSEAIYSYSDGWQGPALVLGPRVYLPVGSPGERVDCYDFSTDTQCAHYPKILENLGNLYTVNQDPNRPTCIWVNSDSGSEQIQNFDAYTGEACGEGEIRVLASQFVVPKPQCEPAEYVSLRVLRPVPATYTSATVQFDNGDGEPILGLPEPTLDATGSVDLERLALNTETGLPQFLFVLNGETEAVGEVEVELTWRGNYEASCVGEKTEVEKTEPVKEETKEPTKEASKEPAKEEPKSATTTTTSPPPAKAEVAAFGEAHLASHEACVASSGYTASVTGSLISSVTFTLNGRKVATVTKPNSHGRFAAHLKVRAGHRSKLVIHVVYSALSKTHTATITKTLARCAAVHPHHRSTPRFTG